MQIDSNTSTKKRFEFPGSKPHYLPLLPFSINHMLLKIKPDFQSKPKKLINCEQQLKITANREIDKIELDAVDIRIESIAYSSTNSKFSNIKYNDYNNKNNKNNGGNTKNNNRTKILDYQSREDKLIVTLPEVLPKGDEIVLNIVYSAGFYRHNGISDIREPRSGFYFIDEYENVSERNLQAWTQGETIESRYWFPCQDQPQVKFSREIHVTVPEEYVVISNGEPQEYPPSIEKEKKHKENENKNQRTWVWIEPNPTSAYLTSVVIGKFAKRKGEYEGEYGKVPLLYYWPIDIQENHAMLTFESTPSILEFLQKYLNTKYPYSKYSQVAVEDFQFGGMENTSCTTLTRRLLHDEKASLDYRRDIEVVCHELAHQWFGDFVTCKDWQHIWLNEGFANYCEALFYDGEYIKNTLPEAEDSPTRNEFYYKILKTADDYFEEATNLYKRAIVTKVYKHPDDMFDNHAYEKGGCVLHMLRNYIGDNKFRKSLEVYLNTYKNSNAETNELCKILEDVSGKNLGLFFDQWLYRAGHPELEIEFSVEHSKKVQIKVMQTQADDGTFEFPLEIRVIFSGDANDKKPATIMISKKVTEESFEIPEAKEVEWISIDPRFKVLKEIKSIKAPKDAYKAVKKW